MYVGQQRDNLRYNYTHMGCGFAQSFKLYSFETTCLLHTVFISVRALTPKLKPSTFAATINRLPTITALTHYQSGFLASSHLEPKTFLARNECLYKVSKWMAQLGKKACNSYTL